MITVSGTVYDTRTGQGQGGIPITGCNGYKTTTIGNGTWSFSVPSGAGYCARVASGIPSNWAGPDTVHNQPDHTGAATYEFQVAGKTVHT